MELAVPCDFVDLVEEAVAKNLGLMMTVRKCAPSNPVLPEEPKFEIVTIERTVGNLEFEELSCQRSSPSNRSSWSRT